MSTLEYEVSDLNGGSRIDVFTDITRSPRIKALTLKKTIDNSKEVTVSLPKDISMIELVENTREFYRKLHSEAYEKSNDSLNKKDLGAYFIMRHDRSDRSMRLDTEKFLSSDEIISKQDYDHIQGFTVIDEYCLFNMLHKPDLINANKFSLKFNQNIIDPVSALIFEYRSNIDYGDIKDTLNEVTNL